jgi:hypothetical protein
MLNTQRFPWRKVFLHLVLSGMFLPALVECRSAKRSAAGDGFVSLFDGKSLNNWEGDSTYWRVENGILVGEVTSTTLLSRNSFLTWRGGIVKDFELKVDYRVSDKGNSGINYRSEEIEGLRYALRGYQADLDGALLYTGSNYEEGRRTTLASRGQKAELPPVAESNNLSFYIKNNFWTKAVVTGTLGHPDSLVKKVKRGDWNEYHLIARGNRLQHFVNGVLMSNVTDNDTANRRMRGLLGVQVHVGPPMKIEYRSIRLKTYRD